jgi:RecA-family ATPase
VVNLPIYLGLRVPTLRDEEHVAQLDAICAATKPVLVIVDPFYLTAKGVNNAQLSEVGTVLDPIQQITQAHGSALMIVHHWNKSGRGSGRERFSGAGTAEWGRVLISLEAKEG